jgi:hypothetical protein
MKMKYIYLFLTLTLYSSIKSADPIIAASAAGWGTALAFDVLSALSPKVRYGLYGNEPVLPQTEQMIRSVTTDLNLQQPGTIKQVRWPWNAVAGNIFSNQDTLFVSKKVNAHISQQKQENASDIFKNLDNSDKKELIMSLLMIGAQYDNKIMALSIITPAAIWALAWFAQWSMKQFNCSASSNDAVKIAYDFTGKFYNSFKAKALTSASLLGAYILYQRYHFGIQATALMI